ncbi:hypothetical protein ACFX2C_008295 [Malus domestica]
MDSDLEMARHVVYVTRIKNLRLLASLHLSHLLFGKFHIFYHGKLSSTDFRIFSFVLVFLLITSTYERI